MRQRKISKHVRLSNNKKKNKNREKNKSVGGLEMKRRCYYGADHDIIFKFMKFFVSN